MSNKVEEGSKLKIGNWNLEIDPYHCEVCNVRANSQKAYDLHLNGRKHKGNQMRNEKYKDKNEYKEEMKNLKKATSKLSKYYCEVCYVYANCQKTYDLHLNGGKHKENQIRKKKYEDTNEFKFHCEVCNVYTNTRKTYDAHLAGQKHQKKIIEIRNQFRLQVKGVIS